MQAQIIGLTLVLVILALIVYLNFKLKKDTSGWKKEVKAKLAELQNQINSGDYVHMKSALIDADKLLEYSLRKNGFKGNTTAEMLKSARKAFDKKFYNDIWAAHKARNILVHEVENTIPQAKITWYFNTLKRAIQILTN